LVIGICKFGIVCNLSIVIWDFSAISVKVNRFYLNYLELALTFTCFFLDLNCVITIAENLILRRLKMSWKKPTAGIILAAGMSTRFGGPKQLQKLKDRYLLDWVLDAALGSQLEGLILVLGHHFETICTALGDSLHHPSLKVVNNPHYREGLSTSLRTGLSHLQHDFSSVMFLLADQPLLNSDNIDLLLARFHESQKDICVPIYQGRRGNPTLFSRNLYHQIEQLTGDVGARDIILTHPDRVLRVEIESPFIFSDIDTPGDLAALKKRLSQSP